MDPAPSVLASYQAEALWLLFNLKKWDSMFEAVLQAALFVCGYGSG
jgi:hypothetical protein